MPVNLFAPNAADLLPVAGVRIGTTMAGVRMAGRRDLSVWLLDEGAVVAGVFTLNRFCAAPVQICREHLPGQGIRALLINTGNANAGTGQDGLAARAQELCSAGGPAWPAERAGTAVLDRRDHGNPAGRAHRGRPAGGHRRARGDAWLDAAQAIMTTDTLPKAASRQLQIGGRTVTLSGIAKGAGMIRPNMATMLGFIATDAVIDAALLQQLTREAADASFNRITVDGDTSTNDCFIAIATRQAGHAEIASADSEAGQALRAALIDLARELAQAIVRDGEGATKFMAITVQGGRDEAECRLAAYAIAHSPLVKTAFYASDPNLGRILAAVGYAGIADLDQSLIDLHLGDVHVVTAGGRHPQYVEADAARVMAAADIEIRVDLHRGGAASTVWTCDFSEDYVRINADYRS